MVYLDRIDARAEGPALKRAVDAIRHRIELERFRPGELGREYAELLRARQEKKMMSVRPKLSQVLRNMPVQWLNGGPVRSTALTRQSIRSARNGRRNWNSCLLTRLP